MKAPTKNKDEIYVHSVEVNGGHIGIICKNGKTPTQEQIDEAIDKYKGTNEKH